MIPIFEKYDPEGIESTENNCMFVSAGIDLSRRAQI